MFGCYDWKIWAIAKAVCRKGDTIVEVGANVGTETVGFSDIVGSDGKVVSFEPVPQNLVRLRESIGIGGLDNVQVEEKAVSNEVGRVEFVSPGGPNSGIGHIDYGDGFRPGRKFTVETTTLDQFLKNTEARLLMMDVEGAEPLVLQGAENWIDTYHPLVIVEAHHNKKEMYEYFQRRGYRVYSIERLGLKTPKVEAEAVQYNWLAIHQNESELAKKVDRTIKICAWLPAIRGIHPLCRV